MRIDPVDLTRRLIRRPSVTPQDEGALDVLGEALAGLGFTLHRLPFEAPGTARVDNLYARIGSGGRHFCFAGHTDVVPPGELAGWSVDPFAAEVIDGHVYGRGAADMKGAIAAFTAAAAGFLADGGLAAAGGGSISLLITGDEEGPAVNGTVKVLGWMAGRGEIPDHCVVGEPTNPTRLGQMMKIGRRGSLNAVLTVKGVQGHVAYPHLADNPLPRLVRMLAPLAGGEIDQGSAHFQPSTLALTSIDVGNPVTNVIPARAEARFNIRFNDLHTSASLEAWLRQGFDREGGDYELACVCSGESFITAPGPLSALVSAAVKAELGVEPELSTTGGTSDARFISRHCPVVEFGLVGQTMHKVDERAAVADIEALTRIYRRILDRYFA